MNKSVIAGLIFCVVVSADGASPAALPPDQQVANELLAVAGDGFRIRETDHFTIAYDTSYDLLRTMTGRLEGTFDAVWAFCHDQGLALTAPTKRLPVIFFDQHENYSRFCVDAKVDARSTAGFYSQQTNRSAFANTLHWPEVRQVNEQIEQVKRQQGTRGMNDVMHTQLIALQNQRDAFVKRFNRFVLQHEAAHQMLFNIGVHIRGADNPGWLVEGLACQFEVPQAFAVIKRARVNQLRLADFREGLGVGPNINKINDQMWQQALDSGRMLPLETFIGDADVFERRDQFLSFRYAQAWALVYYLQKDHRPAFGNYLRSLSAREPGKKISTEQELADFSAAFGPVTAEFEKRWLTFILKLRVEPDEGE